MTAAVVPTRRFVLRDLPLAPRLVISLFLISVGVGYFAALVQLHFQHASKGSALPTPADAVAIFAGQEWPRDDAKAKPTPASVRPTSHLERLLTGAETLPFNGTGSMASAFTKRSEDWKDAIKRDGEEKVRAEREGERLALLAWVQGGAKLEPYEHDRFVPPTACQSLTPGYRDGNAVKVRSILTDRCVRCHSETGEQSKYPLETSEQLAKYLKIDDPKTSAKQCGAKSRQISLEKLTQSTHVHLLSFSMLYGLTGFILAFSRLPGFVRSVLAPLTLLAQIADISCWWLARLDGIGPYFALGIVGTGAVVGGSLSLQIVISLFDLYGKVGKTVLLALFVAAGFGFVTLKTQIIDQQIAGEQRELDEEKARQTPKEKSADDVKAEAAKAATEKEAKEAKELEAKEKAETEFKAAVRATLDEALKERAEKEAVGLAEKEKAAREAADKTVAEKIKLLKDAVDRADKDAAAKAATFAAERTANEKALADQLERLRAELTKAKADKDELDRSVTEKVRQAVEKALKPPVEKLPAPTPK